MRRQRTGFFPCGKSLAGRSIYFVREIAVRTGIIMTTATTAANDNYTPCIARGVESDRERA